VCGKSALRAGLSERVAQHRRSALVGGGNRCEVHGRAARAFEEADTVAEKDGRDVHGKSSAVGEPSGPYDDAVADDDLVQVAERALADAEQAYRLDPSDANQRRVMSAWSFVRNARERVEQDRRPRRAVSDE
jgi:hypothetical protein